MLKTVTWRGNGCDNRAAKHGTLENQAGIIRRWYHKYHGYIFIPLTIPLTGEVLDLYLDNENVFSLWG